MLDIRFVREHSDAVRKDLEKRRDTEKIAWLDVILGKDAEWRKLKRQSDDLRAERNTVSEEINEAKKAGKDPAALIERAKSIPAQLRSIEEKMDDLHGEIRSYLMRLPNITTEDVPYGESDDDNEVVEEFGEKPDFAFTPKNHTELLDGLAEFERAAKIAGSRFYFLQGSLALLEHALQSYALSFMTERGYTPLTVPHMMHRSAYEGVTSLDDFEDVLYKIEGEDLHLIATSEHPMTAQFKGEVLTELPVKLAGVSPCYRKETGSHGKEEKGIWRVHQFSKVEQVVICRPGDSEKYHEEITRNAIDFFQSLGIHFRQVLICTGDLGIVASKKYDLEAWIPSVGQYKEIVSSSNCTAYQAVRLGIRCREGSENRWVHTLNATCCATSRALVAIIEQYQQPDGTILVPDVLQPYLHGRERL